MFYLTNISTCLEYLTLIEFSKFESSFYQTLNFNELGFIPINQKPFKFVNFVNLKNIDEKNPSIAQSSPDDTLGKHKIDVIIPFQVQQKNKNDKGFMLIQVTSSTKYLNQKLQKSFNAMYQSTQNEEQFKNRTIYLVFVSYYSFDLDMESNKIIEKFSKENYKSGVIIIEKEKPIFPFFKFIPEFVPLSLNEQKNLFKGILEQFFEKKEVFKLLSNPIFDDIDNGIFKFIKKETKKKKNG